MEKTLPPLPADINAERCLLGSILLNEDAFYLVKDVVTEGMFYTQKHAWIYDAVEELARTGTAIDIATVFDFLRRTDRIDAIGGITYLSELTMAPPTYIHAEYYAGIVKRTAMFRRLIQMGGEISAMGYDERRELDEVLRAIDDKLDEIQSGKKITPIPANRLFALNIPPVRIIIPQLLVQGFGFLAAAPGMGKTWLLLQWAIAKASGGYIFGDIPVEKSRVLFLALEDTQASLQERLRKLCPSAPPPEDLLIITKDSEWRPIDEGGLGDLESMLRLDPEINLVIIDTLTAISPTIPRGNPYREEYKAFRPLADLADKYRVAIIGAYHFNQGGRKDIMEMVNGTAGLPSVAVNRLGIVRERGEKRGQIVSVSKRASADIDWLLEFDPDTCQWVRVGETKEVRKTEQRQIILDILSAQGEMSIKDIVEASQVSYNGVVQMMKRLKDDGLVLSPRRGIYQVHDSHDSHDSPKKGGVMNVCGNGKSQNGVHDSMTPISEKKTPPKRSHESHEQEQEPNASEQDAKNGKKFMTPPSENGVMNGGNGVMNGGGVMMVKPQLKSPDGYTHWNQGGLWYAATALAPQTVVANGFKKELDAVMACYQHRRDKELRYEQQDAVSGQTKGNTECDRPL